MPTLVLSRPVHLLLCRRKREQASTARRACRSNANRAAFCVAQGRGRSESHFRTLEQSDTNCNLAGQIDSFQPPPQRGASSRKHCAILALVAAPAGLAEKREFRFAATVARANLHVRGARTLPGPFALLVVLPLPLVFALAFAVFVRLRLELDRGVL